MLNNEVYTYFGSTEFDLWEWVLSKDYITDIKDVVITTSLDSTNTPMKGYITFGKCWRPIDNDEETLYDWLKSNMKSRIKFLDAHFLSKKDHPVSEIFQSQLNEQYRNIIQYTYNELSSLIRDGSRSKSNIQNLYSIFSLEMGKNSIIDVYNKFMRCYGKYVNGNEDDDISLTDKQENMLIQLDKLSGHTRNIMINDEEEEIFINSCIHDIVSNKYDPKFKPRVSSSIYSEKTQQGIYQGLINYI